jgi:hypothetical protein
VIGKDGHARSKAFTDISLSWNKMDYIATVAEAWKNEGHFVAANVAAYLYRSYFAMSVPKQEPKDGMKMGITQLLQEKRSSIMCLSPMLRIQP